MNISFVIYEAREPIALSVENDNRVYLKEREAELVKIIESVQSIQASKGWSTLKTKVFDPLADSLTKEIHSEARKEIPDTLKLNRLSGQLKWAERFSDLKKLEDSFRSELSNVRIKDG